MRNATRIGNAYIAVTADGSGINDDIVDSVDGADVGASGDRAGRDYGDNFSEGFEERMDAAFDRIGENLGKRLGRSISGSMTRAFNGTGENSLGGRIGATIGEALSEGLENSFSQVLDRMEERAAELAREMGTSGGGGGGVSRNSSRLYPNRDPDDAVRIRAQEADRAFDRARGRMLDMAIAMNERFDRDQHLNLERAYRQNEAFDRTRTRMLAEAHRLNIQFEEGRLGGDGRSNGSRSGSDSDSSLGDRIGKLLGGGSRNNFLNFFGKSIGNVIGLTEKLTRGAAGLGSTFQEGFSAAAQGAGFFTRAGGGVGAVLRSITASAAASLPALAVGLGAAAIGMSVLVSVASALLAIMVALTSTIASGLVAALAVGAAGLGAVAVAGGLAAIAFTSLTDAQKSALKADFAPLKQELTGLGQLMLTQIIPYFENWSSNLQVALYQLAPLASVFGDALGRAGSQLTASLSGPGFALLTQQLGVFLPQIVQRLSLALGQFLNGLAGTFAALLPSVNRFAGYLVDVATRFANFASSAEGQNKIADFIDRAISSLISFKGFIQEALGFVSDLLFSTEAQTAGNSIFDSLRDSFKGFREDLKGDDLKHWFERALDFGSDVKDLIIAIKDAIKKLDSDGTLKAVGDSFKQIASLIQTAVNVADDLYEIIKFIVQLIFNPAAAGATIFDKVGEAVDNLGGKVDGVIGKVNILSAGAFGAMAAANNVPVVANPTGPLQGPGLPGTPQANDVPTAQALVDAGKKALEATSVSSGGYKPDPIKTTPKKPEYKNPYVAFANGLIKDGPKVAAQIRNAIIEMNKKAGQAIKDATSATSGGDVTSAFSALSKDLKASAEQGVNTAQSALNSAANSLANASSKKAAKAALKDVKQAQRDLAAAVKNQEKVNAAAKIVNGQKIVSESNVNALLNGFFTQNATLADYAEARGRLAAKLDDANQKLADAISLRDDYNRAVIDGVNAFGSILTAQAKTINGVQQALTATDITTNLQDRLSQIRKFQSDLNILLAQGLSQAGYKQLVDAGVEQGGAYAAALVQGGQGSVGQVNNLVEQINDAAESLGGQASDRLYQAGVSAAQGLVDGLTSLSAQLDSAATTLGNSIADAVKRALGINSPSRVMIDQMGYVGDGIVVGLQKQHAKVGMAASSLSGQVAMTPSLAARYAVGTVPDAVSGNSGDPRFRDLIVHTPTADPEGVAREVLNEVTGRL